MMPRNILNNLPCLEARFGDLVPGKLVIHSVLDGVHHPMVIICLESNDPRFVTRKLNIAKVASE